MCLPLPCKRQHLSSDACLEDKREDNQNCSVLCCVRQLCTMIYAHTCEQFLNLYVCLGLDLISVCSISFGIILFLCCLLCCVGFSFFSTKLRDYLGRMFSK